MSEIMYRRGIMNALVSVFGDAFSSIFEPDPLVSIHFGIEYPMQAGEYPYCLIDFEEDSISNNTVSSTYLLSRGNVPYKHWAFSGSSRFSFFSLSAAERDTLIDGFIKAVGMDDILRGRFRDDAVNPYIAMEVAMQDVRPSGYGATPGTPWGTDDVVYYVSFDLATVGEFWTTEDFVPEMIERIEIYPDADDQWI